MEMDSFITKDGKKLRRGYTTGSCAAAASKAAALMLLENREIETVWLMTPRGIGLTLEVKEPARGENFASCGIVKDSGDDPDVTNGMTVYARVEKTDEPHGILVDGGEGIGRVTKPGLDQPVGAAAINSTPRRMITEALLEVMEDAGYGGGLSVVISAPEGVELAKKTFNPRLGIVGGLSILGTTGIVEPMSDEAVAETIRTELSMRAASGRKTVLFVPGNYGADFIKNNLGIDPEAAVTVSNFIGDAFSLAAEAGFLGALLIGHIGKLVKVAGGMFNTHSRWGDCRAEIIAAHAGMCGAPADAVRRIMDSAMTDDMLSILEEAGLREAVMASVTERMGFHLAHQKTIGGMQTGAMTFSNVYGILGATPAAYELLEEIRKESLYVTHCRSRMRGGGPHHAAGKAASRRGGSHHLRRIPRQPGPALLCPSGLRTAGQRENDPGGDRRRGGSGGGCGKNHRPSTEPSGSRCGSSTGWGSPATSPPASARSRGLRRRSGSNTPCPASPSPW